MFSIKKLLKNNFKLFITLILFSSGINIYSQNINGNIQNEKKYNLEGVVISVEGENIGTITDKKGDFSIELNNIDENKNFIIHLGGYEKEIIKISDFVKHKKKTIVLKENITNLQEVVLVPKGMKEKNLGVKKKSNIRYFGYDSEKDNSLFKEHAVKIKNHNKIKIKNINITLTDYKIDTPILLMFDIYSSKNNSPDESLIKETLFKEITNDDIKNNVLSFNVSDKNIWINEDDFFVSVRLANNFKGYLYLSGNIFVMSQNTFYKLYNGNWNKYSGAPSINLDVLIKR